MEIKILIIVVLLVAASVLYYLITGKSAEGVDQSADATSGTSDKPIILSSALRDMQYGRSASELDCSDSGEDVVTAPWSEFCVAHEHIAAAQNEEAIAVLRGIVEAPGQEPRSVIWAWELLRSLGVEPRMNQASKLFGVVYEYGAEGGFDILSAYADHTVRYFGYAGGGVMWEPADAELLPFVDRLLASAQQVADLIGVHGGDDLPDPPEMGRIQLTFLTPGGLRISEGETEVLAADSMSGPVISAAVRLISELGRRYDEK